MLLKLLAYLYHFLIPPQALLVLHLVESPLLVLCIRGLESSLRMAIELVLLFGGEVERVEHIVDARGVERAGFGLEVTESGVDAARLLLGFGGFAFGLGGERGFFFAQESFLFRLLTRGLGGLFSGCLAVRSQFS
jgi:hypothetical protein